MVGRGTKPPLASIIAWEDTKNEVSKNEVKVTKRVVGGGPKKRSEG
jgi:hypothetical protein